MTTSTHAPQPPRRVPLRKTWRFLGHPSLMGLIAVMALVVAVAGVALQLPPDKGILAPSDGVAVQLSAAAVRARKVKVSAKISRPPRPGHAYWLIMTVHNLSGIYDVWYPRAQFRSDSSVVLSIPDRDPIGILRTAQVYEVTEDVSERYASVPPQADRPLSEPPCSCTVSNEVTLPYHD
jgi:hypothetical protein